MDATRWSNILQLIVKIAENYLLPVGPLNMSSTPLVEHLTSVVRERSMFSRFVSSEEMPS
jgi:hypothetical protein